jgi:UDP-glucose 4-epimerase
MKIFVTGVAGFLGSHLADRMIEIGHEVVGVDNLIGGNIRNVNNKVDFHKCDCDDLENIRRLMKGCDVVFHAACTAHDGFSVFSPYFITKNTFQITMSVLSAAIQNKVDRFVYCSSMARYGEQECVPFTESLECKPCVPYGVAKYSSELIIRQLCDLNNIEYVIVVPHNIIGSRQNYTDPFRNVVSIMVNRMLQGKQPIIYGDGSHQRCFSHINDVIYCLERTLTEKNVIGEVINIGPDEDPVTISELASRIAKLLNFELRPIHINDRPGEVKLAVCSSDKARELLGYSTRYSLEDGIRDVINYIKNNGVKEFDYNYDIEIINEKTPKSWVDKLL